jgi:hypothetical protein
MVIGCVSLLLSYRIERVVSLCLAGDGLPSMVVFMLYMRNIDCVPRLGWDS